MQILSTSVCKLKLGDFLKKIRSLTNEIKMCRICTSNVSCGSGDMGSSATGRELGICHWDGAGPIKLLTQKLRVSPMMTTFTTYFNTAVPA